MKIINCFYYKKCLLIFCLFFSFGVVNAQNTIDSFFGLNLGMSYTQVINRLNSQAIHYERKNSSKEEYLHLSNVQLGDCVFETLNLAFENGKLVRGSFFNDDAAGGNPDAPAFYRVARNAREFKNTFNIMYANLLSKYGEPQIANGEQYIWIKANKLTLDYTYTDEYDGPYVRFANTMIRVRYQLSNGNSANY